LSFCILKDNYFLQRKSIERRYSLNNLLIFFGGIDKENCTKTLLLSLADRMKDFDQVDVVVGMANPNKLEIEGLCSKHVNCSYHEQIDYMAELIAKADFAIGACGATNGERMYLGLPSIVFSVADNQVDVAKFLHEKEYVYYVGDHSLISSLNLQKAVVEYLATKEKRRRISSNLLAKSDSELEFWLKD
jgi:UDP-2,4-diacetamido-2,4,6-trideoxy-beta-L-altropyranose hydrolase